MRYLVPLLGGVLSDEFTWKSCFFSMVAAISFVRVGGTETYAASRGKIGAIGIALVIAPRAVLKKGVVSSLYTMSVESEDRFQNHPSWHHRWYGRHRELILHCDDAACVRVGAAWLMREKENALLLLARYAYDACV